MVVFATQNLTKDAPFSKLDLVCCRNVLIYMDSILQKKILPLFHYTLNPLGYLFLGSSETIGDFSNRFRVIDARWKIFQRKGVVPEHTAGHPLMPFYGKTSWVPETARQDRQHTPIASRLAESAILQSYAPPCVLVNDEHKILYFHGNTEKFLTPPTGEPTFDLLEMARNELREELRIALRKAAKENKTVISRGLRVRHDGAFVTFDVVVKPVADHRELSGLMIVAFESKARPAKRTDRSEKTCAGDKIDVRVKALEQKLESTKEYLRATIEELETSNEELKAANEELQSTAEEMQSTNEELETSREELQSMNEELETVNLELKDKVDQLSNANDDLNNLIGSIDAETIFLDMDLCIKRFSSNVKRVFSLIDTDIGRPISDLASRIDYRDLSKDAAETLRTLVPKEVSRQAEDGVWFSIRILPYRTVENVVDGIVLTCVDVTEIRDASQNRRLAIVLKDSNDAITLLDLDGNITAWNHGAEKMYGYSEAEALKMNIRGLIPAGRKKEALDFIDQIRVGRTVDHLKTQRLAKDGHILDVQLTVTKLEDGQGNIVAVATTGRDITESEKLMRTDEARGNKT